MSKCVVYFLLTLSVCLAWQVSIEIEDEGWVGADPKVNSFKLSDSDVNLNVKWDDFHWENVIKKLNHLFRRLLTLRLLVGNGVWKFLSPVFPHSTRILIDKAQNIETT